MTINEVDLMHKTNKISKKKNQKFSPIPDKQSTGIPVRTATINVGTSKIYLEIPDSSFGNATREFAQSSEDIDLLVYELQLEQIAGALLLGKQSICRCITEKLIKRGIRPLIGDSKKQKSKSQGFSGLKGIPVINEYVAGIDIGQKLIYVAIPPHFDENHTRVFGTFTIDLESIVDWLKEHEIKTVAMEATSIYWLPLFELCERNGIKPMIVNPKHVKMLPGRKTDVLDSQWLMRLLACGLLQGGMIPPQPYRALRDLARHRQDLMDRAGDSLNRMHKMLELMNIKLGNAISDISGKSGTDIIRAIGEGERDPNKLAQLASDRCKSSKKEIAKALTGTYSEECIFVMKQELVTYEFFHKKIEETELKIEELLEKLPDIPNLAPLPKHSKKRKVKKVYDRSPYCFDLRSLLYRKFGYDLTVISGIGDGTAAVIIFETGGNLDAFPTIKHFASWCGVSPGNKISGGKVISTKGPKKFSRVGQAFRIAANANYRAKNATGAFMRRLDRHGKKGRAVRKAAAHKICCEVYNIVKHGQEYHEKSAEAYEKKYEERKIYSMTKSLREMGFEVIDKRSEKLIA